MELQKKSIDALLESMAILRQELQNNQDSEKEIELLGELKLLSARIYIESDLAVMSMLPDMTEDLTDSAGEFDVQLNHEEDELDIPVGEEINRMGFNFGTVDSVEAAAELEDADLEDTAGDLLEEKQLEELFEQEGLDEGLFEAENPAEIKISVEDEKLLAVDAEANVAEEVDTELNVSSVISSTEEDVAANEMEEDVAPKEKIPLQQDLFFAAVPVLGGQKNSNIIQNEVAKNAIEEDAVAKIANIDFDSPEFKLPEFELPEFDLENVEVVSPIAEVELTSDVAIPPVAELDLPLAEVVFPSPVDVVPAVTEVVPSAAEIVLPISVEEVQAVTEVVSPAAELTPQIPVEVIPSVVEEVPTATVSTLPPVEIAPPPISAINTRTERPVDTSSSVQLNENGELPPPALSGMNVEAIVNQMPISRRFEFANLLFGGDIQRMGTFIHELLQAPTGSGRMDVYERWYDENNWRRRDEAASDMLRLIKRIFPS